jgi:hypothetical protein
MPKMRGMGQPDDLYRIEVSHCRQHVSRVGSLQFLATQEFFLCAARQDGV